MRIHKCLQSLILLGVGCSLAACSRAPEGWIPLLEETSTAFLETETDRVFEHVQTARANLRTDPGQAERALTEAEFSLDHLRVYYLPLFQARERAYNAYRYLYLGDGDRSAEELGKIQETLEGMAESLEGGALREVELLSGVVAEARIAALADPTEAAPLLESVARRLDLVVVKGDLIVDSR